MLHMKALLVIENSKEISHLVNMKSDNESITKCLNLTEERDPILDVDKKVIVDDNIKLSNTFDPIVEYLK